MKKIILLAIAVIMLTGCGNVDYEYSKDYRMSEVYITANVTIRVDTETCVEYISEYNRGTTVMYNQDGTIKLNKECLNDK